MSADVRTEQLAADLARRDAQLAAALELADAAVVEVGRALLSWEADAASARATLASCDRARAGAETEVDRLRAVLMDLVSHYGSTGVGPLWKQAREVLEGCGTVYPPGFWGRLALRLLGQRDAEHARVVELERSLSAERAKVEALRAALERMTPAKGFPECSEKCLRQRFGPDEEPECCCGMAEIRHFADRARVVLAEVMP